MHVFEIIIGLLLAGAALTWIAHKIGTPYPALLALAGAGLALVPGTPTLSLDPELALALFVAPVLLDAAFDASPRDLKEHWRTVAGLAIGATVLTTIVVAYVARLLVPDLPWAAAIALGAIVAPPDAAAASAVLKHLKPPYRLLVILGGESLFNDASALLIYRFAVVVTVAGALSPVSAIPLLLLITGGSVVLGYILSRIVVPLIARIEDAVITVMVQFGGTFAVWILAERLHLSGILTMVVFAMSAAQRSGARTPARVRIQSYAVWEFAVFVLNMLAFILVGFQLKAILARLDSSTLVQYIWVAVAVCAAVIVARIVWVMFAAYVTRHWLHGWQWTGVGADSPLLSNKSTAIIAWCGMRGIVTLAAALALPVASPGIPEFPQRDLIVFIAFSVVLGTLVVQGITLRPLMNWLRPEDDGIVEREVRLARMERLRSALGTLRALPSNEVCDLLRRRYEMMMRRAEELDAVAEASSAQERGERGLTPEEVSPDLAEGAAAVRSVIREERKRLVALRREGAISDPAFQQVEQELDLEELYLGQLLPTVSKDH